MTKLASALPQGGNGLDFISHKLVAKPHDRHVVVGIVDCSKVTTDHDNGSVEPTARVRRLEVVDPDDLALAERLVRRGLDRRLGASVLPMSIEDDIAEAFGTSTADEIPDEQGEALDDDLRAEVAEAIEELRRHTKKDGDERVVQKFGRAARVLRIALERLEENGA